MTWGNNSSGQLGHGDLQSVCEPTLVKELQFVKVQAVSAGWSHTPFISGNGEAMTWGNNSSGQLGHGDFQRVCEPTLVKELQLVKVQAVSAGWSHTPFISGRSTSADP
ncbi:hypothetical protein L7F22_012010 [Adiantum nelumboides]|nr:hypothetical protein [Adiantum nelumboides]